MINSEKPKKIFFISPSRMATPENTKACGEYVAKLEKKGCRVHWPIRNTDQNDPIGINICDANLKKIYEAEEIHVWYLKESAGIHFDMGSVYMLIRILGWKKKIIFANKHEFLDMEKNPDNALLLSKGKNFAKVLFYLEGQTKDY